MIIGFDYRVTLEDMEFAAFQDPNRSRGDLITLFREHVGRNRPGRTTQESTATIMLNIWHGRSGETEAVSHLRMRARSLLTETEARQRRALHWGMALLVYPFFRHFAKQVGLALQLDREVLAERINRKIKRIYGERRKVEVASKAVISSMREWGALEMVRHGVYVPTERLAIDHPDLRLWLAEVLIYASEAEMVPLDVINRSPELFPFSVNLSIPDLRASERLEVDRQGLDFIMVGCRERIG